MKRRQSILVTAELFVTGKNEDNESKITFFVSDVGMNNSQCSRPGNGFFFFQDLQQEEELSQRSRLAKP